MNERTCWGGVLLDQMSMEQRWLMFSQPSSEPCQTAKAGTDNVGGEAAAATSDSCPHQNTSAAQLLSGVGISFKPPFYETPSRWQPWRQVPEPQKALPWPAHDREGLEPCLAGGGRCWPGLCATRACLLGVCDILQDGEVVAMTTRPEMLNIL